MIYFNKYKTAAIENIEDRAVIEFGLETGLRASDIIGIITSNIDFEHQFIKVWDEKKDEWRTVVFPKSTGNILKMYLNARMKNGQKLFLYSEKTLQRKLQDYCRKANIRTIKKSKTGTSVGWHWLRHTFIRRSQMFGRDIKLVQQNTGDTIDNFQDRKLPVKQIKLTQGCNLYRNNPEILQGFIN